MSTLKSVPLAALLLVAGACSKGYDSPFASTTVAAPLPARAAIVFSSNSYGSPGSPNELFAIEATGAGLTRLTFCNRPDRLCANLEAAVAPDRTRAIVRRVLADSNRDGRLDGRDDAGLVFVNLSRGVEALLLPETARVSGIDWSPTEELLLLSSAGEGGLDDLFTLSPKGENSQNFTNSASVRERRPRFNSRGSTGIYERIDEAGKGQVHILFSLPRVTAGGPGSEPLPGTPWVVGSDADPDFSPDDRLAVFRRLTGTGNGGLGTWDVMTVNLGDGSLAMVASGPAYRGAPDWGPQGIVFNEVDPGGGTRMVVLQPDGSDRRVLLTVASSFDLSNPRWLP